MTQIIKSFNDKAIRIRQEDKYLSLTDMAKATDKLFGNWNQLSSTKEYLDELSSVIGLPATTLIDVSQGGVATEQGTWGHPKVAEEFARWCSLPAIKRSHLTSEASVRDKLALELNGQTEVPCMAGVVDIVTSDKLIEVKQIKNWKAAIGQVLVYKAYFPRQYPCIHLFKDKNVSTEYKIQVILGSCLKLGILCSFEDKSVETCFAEIKSSIVNHKISKAISHAFENLE